MKWKKINFIFHGRDNMYIYKLSKVFVVLEATDLTPTNSLLLCTYIYISTCRCK